MPWFPADLIPLVMTDDVATRAELEEQFGVTQVAAVTILIEETCWGDDLPQFAAGNGTANERREAFRVLWRKQGRRKFERLQSPSPSTH